MTDPSPYPPIQPSPESPPAGTSAPEPAAAVADVRRTALVVAGLLILGVLGGVTWAFTAPTTQITVTDQIVGFTQEQSAGLFGAVAVFVFVSAVLGLLVGLLVWFLLPRSRGLSGLLYAVVAAVAVSAIAMEVGRRIASARYEVDRHTPGVYDTLGDIWLDGARLGDLPAPWLLLICAPGLAALVYFFLVSAKSDPDLGRGDLPEPADRGPVYVPGSMPPVLGPPPSGPSAVGGPGADPQQPGPGPHP
ncbi:DUF2567 domain-containing protein [Gordonia sp. VNK21]|uniref:DUF2567 domain-containing protein n=1 Tax=Gordonia sp. VNK21 TaxID=3382483 RepID=UPI0038D3DD56